jgi:ribosomal protein S8
MDNVTASFAREVLNMVQAQGLIQSFQIDEQGKVTVALKSGLAFEQNTECAIAFCRGLIEAKRLTSMQIVQPM